MRILHTSDWHIGKLVYERSVLEDQEHVLQQLFEVIRSEKPQAVLIAGDVFDRQIPPTEAVKLLEWALEKITIELQTPALLISGNHDSGERLGFGSKLLDPRRIRIIGSFEEMEVPMRLADEHGEVAIYGIPYFDPLDVRVRSGEEKITQHQAALEWCTRRIQELRGKASIPAIAVAHTFVRNSQTSESERPLSIGGTDQVDARLFEPFCYTALGHLHRPQNPTSRSRYCGSPLAYHFDEHDSQKSFTLVELGNDRTPSQTLIPISPKRRMRIVSGTFDEILAEGRRTPSQDFILARRTWDGPRVDMMGQLRSVYPNILAIENIMPTASTINGGANAVRREDMRTGRNTFETFEHFFREQGGAPMTSEQSELIRKIIEEASR